MITKVKELRVHIDGISHLIKNLTLSDEIEKSYDSLILAKAWLGKVLGELGTESPYKNDGKRSVVEDIEDTADTGSKIPEDWEHVSYIGKVDWLRQEIKAIWDKVMNSDFHTVKFDEDDLANMYWENFYTHLSEARFWLGFELERIKNEQ